MWVKVHNIRVALSTGPPRLVICRTLLVADNHHAPPYQLRLAVYGLGRVKYGRYNRPPLASPLNGPLAVRNGNGEVLELELCGWELTHDFVRECLPAGRAFRNFLGPRRVRRNCRRAEEATSANEIEYK